MTLKTIALALALALAPVRQANASVSVTVNGSSYTIPQTNEKGWGANVTSWIQAISAASLYPGSASFSLTSELDFGSSYGLKSLYYKTRTANPASAGQFRLANTDLIEWRNFANGGDLSLGVNTSDQLTFNGNPIVGSAALTANRALVSSAAGLISPATTTATEIGYVNGVTSAIQTQIDAKSPLASPTFTGTSTTPAFILSGGTATTVPYLNASKQLTSSAVTPTELGYLSGVTSAIQTQIAAKSNTASPTFTGTVTTPALIVSGATATTVPYLDASKQLTSSAVTPTELGYVSGVTSAIQTQLTARTLKSTLSAKGSTYVATAAGTPADLPVGTDGFVYTADSASAGGIKWAAATAAPTAPDEVSNLGLAASVATNALTIALKQADGSSDPAAAASAVKIGMRSSTATSGAYNQRSVTAALPIVVPASTTIGTRSAIAEDIFVYAIDNAGTVELAVSLNGGFDQGALVNTTAISAGTSRSTLYSTTARTGVAIRLIGRLTATEATAGTWATSPAALAVYPVIPQLIGKGTQSNDSAATGYVGEYIEALQTSSANFAATTVYNDLGSVNLTPGDWDISMEAVAILNGATMAGWGMGIGTASGSSGTGLSLGPNSIDCVAPTGTFSYGCAIAPYRASVAVNTTYYAKMYATYSAGTPQYRGRISARRVR